MVSYMHFEDVRAVFVGEEVFVRSELVISDYGLDEPDRVVDGNADSVNQIDESIAARPLYP